MITVYIAGQTGSELTHIINGTGSTVNTPVTTATANSLWLNPTFSVEAGGHGTNIDISFPTESWHSYQVQYQAVLGSPGWLNFGGLVSGNDAMKTILDSSASAGRFYRVVSH